MKSSKKLVCYRKLILNLDDQVAYTCQVMPAPTSACQNNPFCLFDETG
jgi:hypothetical protein